MLCSVGAFAIWRRDVVLELQGFSRSFTCEDIEFTFRVHRHFRKTGTPYCVHSLTDPVGVTEGPQSIRSLVSQRARWQRVIAETVWSYRGMLCNPRYGTVGCVGMPYYVAAEVLAPVFQLLAVIAVPVAAMAGVLRWDDLLRTLAILALGNGIFTSAAILLQERAFRTFSARDLPYMIALGPLELFLYRPFIMFAQVKGTIDFLFGDREWHKFERNPRETHVVLPTRATKVLRVE
jgi:cellulose synthase/poly-beta-1,6-N-acetylglucosamine synthase-like glycosyltransferase